MRLNLLLNNNSPSLYSNYLVYVVEEVIRLFTLSERNNAALKMITFHNCTFFVYLNVF